MAIIKKTGLERQKAMQKSARRMREDLNGIPAQEKKKAALKRYLANKHRSDLPAIFAEIMKKNKDQSRKN
jgi:hypothetical protein